ncbi:phytoene desaturase family protein [Saccharomonospora piscinae]|uniref:phytoene desaturase family protein n=1 Tax=Saccharomonospora piscinae TaxID=687388 RepID=UPI000465628C|nr:NAD(P)/FAD-dependent oxidoreductase [Saccharomonospora piscinae]
MSNAVVVGSGPNGLAAAVTLARAGVSVTVLEAEAELGGGTRSGELTLPGLLHDHCSAIHPTGAGSPFLRSLDLAAHGLHWAFPEIDLTHPLDGGDSAVLVRSLDDTAAGLGVDGPSWRRLFGPLTDHYDALSDEILRPIAHLPRHPLLLARFGLAALPPATLLARRWRTERARALFAGLAAHAIAPLSHPASPAVGLVQGVLAHRHGWPVARGGSRAITAALADVLRQHGGVVETGVRVSTFADIGEADTVLLDLAPGNAARILGDRLPPRVARAYRAYRHGPAVFKVDLAVHGGVPWRDEASRRAGTVHVGGTLAEIAHAERDIARGRMPARPFVLVGQQYLADPTRSAGDLHPVYAYAHVPHGYLGDATGVVLDQLERFAPGLRERVAATAVTSPAGFERTNANYVGGDVITGANSPWQLLARPRLARDPYSTGIPGVYLCSAATPPGAGVHGMCGHHAARSALRHLGLG